MTSSRTSPNQNDASRILTEVMGGEVARMIRFPTGLAHYVYDARLADGRSYVVRMTRAEQAREFAGAVYWYRRLKPQGIPLPELSYEDVQGSRHGFPVMIMDRLPGSDLGHVYPSLSTMQKRRIAGWVAGLQHRVETLPLGPGFGYALSYDDPTLKSSWWTVLVDSLDRSRRRIQAAGVVAAEIVDPLMDRLDAFETYLWQIEPVPFLHDTTTKNVIIDQGEPAGIVDVDELCFGDPLFTPALTRMALLAHGNDTDYVDLWERQLNLTGQQHDVVMLYTAIHCAAFLSELGQPFNTDDIPTIDSFYRQHLLSTLAELLEATG